MNADAVSGPTSAPTIRAGHGATGRRSFAGVPGAWERTRIARPAPRHPAGVAETKRDGEHKSALVVSPTHAEANRITDAIRASLKTQGKLTNERMVQAWVPAHLTDVQKADPTQYDPGDLIQFHQNAPGHTKGSRLVVGDGVSPPVKLAERFEAYRSVQLALGVGDRVRVTAGGKIKDGKHRLSNGSL